MRIVVRTSTRASGFASSEARPIPRQPACADASSSSGLVFPSTRPIRAVSENGRSVNAPVSPEMRPAPRATLPSHVTVALRSIRGTALRHHFDATRVRRPSRLELQHLAKRAYRDLELVERRLARRQPLQPAP